MQLSNLYIVPSLKDHPFRHPLDLRRDQKSGGSNLHEKKNLLQHENQNGPTHLLNLQKINQSFIKNKTRHPQQTHFLVSSLKIRNWGHGHGSQNSRKKWRNFLL